MSFDIETDEDLNDLEWPVTSGDCTILVIGYLLALIGTGAMAAWVLAHLVSLVFEH